MVQVHVYRVNSDGQPEYLLLKRAPDEPAYPNVWQVITGGIEHGERSADAAIRELAEETGLTALHWQALPTVAVFYAEHSDRIILSPVFGCRVAPDAQPVLSDEHCQYRWLDLQAASGLLVFSSQIEGMRFVHNLVLNT